MPDTTDPAALDGIRERAEAVNKAVAQLADAAIEASATQVPEVAARPAILARLASSFDVPALLAAVEAALKLHQGVTDGDYPESLPLCVECGEWSPCTTVAAITAALAGKEAGDDR